MFKVHSIFESISGEAGGFPQGAWCTFIRLQGCNLNCAWCDAPQARDLEVEHSSQLRSLVDILTVVKQKGNRRVLITGGEPLLQPAVTDLIDELLDQGHQVQVETNGSFILPPVPNVYWVVDYKCPSSGQSAEMTRFSSAFSYHSRHLIGLHVLQQQKQVGGIWIKYVAADEEDVDFAISTVRKFHDEGLVVPQIISPLNAAGQNIPGIVRQIMVKEAYLLDDLIFSVQLHKICDML